MTLSRGVSAAMRRAREGYDCGSSVDQPRRDLRTLADEIDRLMLQMTPDPTPEQAAEWATGAMEDAAGIRPLGAGPWSAFGKSLTRDQVMSLLNIMPATAKTIGRQFGGFYANRFLNLLSTAGLAHYDKSARVWRKTEGK